MSELTDKQEKFAQAVAAGKTYADAYREAYPVSEKWKDESIWCESSKLMADPKVLQRVKQIQEQQLERISLVYRLILTYHLLFTCSNTYIVAL